MLWGVPAFLTFATIGAIGLQDAISKLLVQDYSPFQIP